MERVEMPSKVTVESLFLNAAATRDIYEFMTLIFPPSWYSIAARIKETGVEFDKGMCLWAPKWSNIPYTIKKGTSEIEAAIKSCFYRVHDCLHQLWGLHLPTVYTEDEYYIFKRVQMCGEVAVLTLTEFIFGMYIFEISAENHIVRNIIYNRHAVPMMFGPLRDKTPLEIAMRMDNILHNKSKPKWVRDSISASKFYEIYVPMLEADRSGMM